MRTIEPESLPEGDRKKLFKILSRVLDVEEDQLRMDAGLVEDLGADSLDLVEITMGMEDEFGVTVADERADGIKTVGDVLEALVELLEEQRGG